MGNVRLEPKSVGKTSFHPRHLFLCRPCPSSSWACSFERLQLASASGFGCPQVAAGRLATPQSSKAQVRGIRHLRSGKDGSHSEPTGAFSRAALGIARRIRKPSAGVNDVNVFCWQRQRLHFNARALLRSVQDSIVNLLANVPKPSESKAWDSRSPVS